MAVSFIPLVGPILACVVDGAFVDMISALKNVVSREGSGAKFYKLEKGLAVRTTNAEGQNIRIVIHPQAYEGRGAMGTCFIDSSKNMPRGSLEIGFDDFLGGFLGLHE